MDWKTARSDVIREQWKIGTFSQTKKQGNEKETRNNFKKAIHLTGEYSASLYHRYCFNELMMRKTRLIIYYSPGSKTKLSF